jgi:hypothetical protein
MQKNNCELCGKKQKYLNADCFFNEWLCDDCYCQYDWQKKGIKAIEDHDKKLLFTLLGHKKS